MRIVNVLEATVPLSRYADPATAPGDLDTSVVAVLTDVMRADARWSAWATDPWAAMRKAA